MLASKRQGRHKDRVLAGKYRLEELLGTGGMGEVYRAERIADGELFAVKILRSEHCADTALVARFLREARAADLVRHPNVVRILETGTDDAGTPFFVQELLRGEDLALCLKSCGGRLTPEIAIDLLLPIVEAMGIAHASGVVHRDLKPGNVYLARINGDTIPKLLDFGISSLAASTEISRITSTGTSLGTPAYMSPEQVMGQNDVDARSDVWSLGVMIYELIAGSLPFVLGDSPGALFVQICTRNPRPLESVVPEVPLDLARVIARCMRRNRAERYATAEDLAADLRCVRNGTAIASSRLLEQEAIAADLENAARVTLARGRAVFSSEDALTVSTPAGPGARSARFSTASHGSTHEIELDAPSSDSTEALKLASVMPPAMSSNWRTGVQTPGRPARAPEAKLPTGSAFPFFACAALVAAGAVFASPWHGGSPLSSAIESTASFAPRVSLTILVVIAFGGGAFGAGRARRHWYDGRKAVAAVIVVVAAIALALAAHLARAVIG